MNYLQMLKILIVIFAFPAHSVLFAAGDPAKGKVKAAVCIACHGPKGISNNPLWPSLAGQKEKYLIKQLKDFKSGKRSEPTMIPFMKSLSDQDMKDLAADYSGLACSP